MEHPINQKRKGREKYGYTYLIKAVKTERGLLKEIWINRRCNLCRDLIFGLAAFGLKKLHVDGATGLLDSNLEGKVEAAINELKENDFVYVHVEAPDEMGHSGDPKKKIEAMENFDKRIVKPILEAQSQFNNELVIAILPDHATSQNKNA